MTNSVSQSSRHKWSLPSSQISRSSILRGGRKKKHILDSSSDHASIRLRVVDHEGHEVTPVPMYHSVAGDMRPHSGRIFLDEQFSSPGSDRKSSTNISTSSFMSSPPPRHPHSLSSEVKDSRPKTKPKHLQAPREVTRKIDNVKQHIVTEEMLDEVRGIYVSETDTITLLDIPPTLISEEADDAEAVKERNIQYAELCKNSIGNEKYVVRSMQTLSGALKNKKIQTDKIVMKDEGTVATIWDIYDAFCDPHDTPENEMSDSPESTVKTTKGEEKRGEKSHSSSSSSTASTGSTSSTLLEADLSGSSLNAESDLQLIMLSDSFQHSLLVMERSIVANIFQPKLAVYRQLPVHEDPYSTVKPELDEESKEDEESSSTPTLKHLWTFSCELTRGCNITSMTWNKENLDLLAVGYGDFDSKTHNLGFICCWSIKNPTWPERVFHCHSCVTSLDFSASNPNQLAVGMFDGTVAIYNVQSQDDIRSCIVDSSTCTKKHLEPVWQVTWTIQARTAWEARVETLVSVSADGRIAKWLSCTDGLLGIDLMKLKKIQQSKKKAADNEKKEEVSSKMTPGLCVDFHPIDSSIYLAGTWEGLIHKCSVSNSEHILDTYQKHSCPVNHIEWSPFSSDVFLSCSSDWTIQLWTQDSVVPVLSFTSTQRAVYAVRWSPNWSTVFAAINERQVEIWDLRSSTTQPTIVHYSEAGVKVTSVLFARGTDCILVGDSDGQVNVYQLKNLGVVEDKQVDSLEDIIHSSASRQDQKPQ